MVTHSFPTKNVYLGLIKKKILGPIAISTALCKNIPRFLLKSENESKCYKLKDIYCEKKTVWSDINENGINLFVAIKED